MKKLIALCAISALIAYSPVAMAQVTPNKDTAAIAAGAPASAVVSDSSAAELVSDSALADADVEEVVPEEGGGLHKELKVKFIEGSAGFMSLVALALVIGLAFCIERIIYLTLSEINAKRFMEDVGGRVEAGDIEGAKDLCRATRGPVASICYQGLTRISESIDNIERSIVSYGSVQAANLEKGCSWITLFISMAPSRWPS